MREAYFQYILAVSYLCSDHVEIEHPGIIESIGSHCCDVASETTTVPAIFICNNENNIQSNYIIKYMLMLFLSVLSILRKLNLTRSFFKKKN